MPKKIPFKELKPNNVTNEVWSAVVSAWENGLSDREAAFRASRETEMVIKASEIKEWKKANSEVAELCEMLHDDIKAVAKMNAKKLLDAGDDRLMAFISVLSSYFLPCTSTVSRTTGCDTA